MLIKIVLFKGSWNIFKIFIYEKIINVLKNSLEKILFLY